MSLKEFNVSGCDAVGFDMDQTMVRYHVPKMEDILCSSMTKVLIQHMGYPEDFRDNVASFKSIMCAGGLICDIPSGSFIKIDIEGRIEKMFYHKGFLSAAEIEEIYPGGVWPHVDKFKNGVFSFAGKYWFMEDNFSVVMMTLLAAMFSHEIDKHTLSTGKKADLSVYQRAFLTFNDAIGMLWDPETYASGTSAFFEYMKREPGQILCQVSDTVKDWLVELRSQGKFVFLMTSSHCDYTNLVMSHCFSQNWTECFDLIISTARKPKFYTERVDFSVVDTAAVPVRSTPETTRNLKRGHWYTEGNGEILNKFICEVLKKDAPVVAYFGDSLKSDIFSPKLLYNWETVYIMDTLRSSESASCPLSKEEESIFFSHEWGPVLFCQSTNKMSLYSHIITSKSSIAIPSVEYLARAGTNNNFSSFSQADHRSYPVTGFHPQPNTSLLLLKDLVKLAKKA